MSRRGSRDLGVRVAGLAQFFLCFSPRPYLLAKFTVLRLERLQPNDLDILLTPVFSLPPVPFLYTISRRTIILLSIAPPCKGTGPGS